MLVSSDLVTFTEEILNRKLHFLGSSILQNLKLFLIYTLRESVQIQNFFWSIFSYIRTEYGDLRSKSLYSVQIQENTDQKKLRIWTLFTK